MFLAIIVLAIALAVLFLLKNAGLKLNAIVVALLALGATVAICISQPVMHKPFSINVIEYLIKINDDGSITTTKQTTTTVLEDKTQK